MPATFPSQSSERQQGALERLGQCDIAWDMLTVSLLQ